MGFIGASAEKGACGLGSGLRDLGAMGTLRDLGDMGTWGLGTRGMVGGWGVLGGHGGVWRDLGGVAWLGGWAAKGNYFLQGESAMTRSRGAQGSACVNTTRCLKMYSGF